MASGKRHPSNKGARAHVTRVTTGDAELLKLVQKYNDLIDKRRKANNAKERALASLPAALRYTTAYVDCWQSIEAYCKHKTEHLQRQVKDGTLPAHEYRFRAQVLRRAALLVGREMRKPWSACFKAQRRVGVTTSERRWFIYHYAAERVRQQALALTPKTAKGLQAQWRVAAYPSERMALVNALFSVAPDVLPQAAVVNTIVTA